MYGGMRNGAIHQTGSMVFILRTSGMDDVHGKPHVPPLGLGFSIKKISENLFSVYVFGCCFVGPVAFAHSQLPQFSVGCGCALLHCFVI